MSKDQKTLGDYERAISLISPHLQPLQSRWYLIEKDGIEFGIHPVNEEGLVMDVVDYPGYVSVESLRGNGWTVTPLLIYKVDTSKVR